MKEKNEKYGQMHLHTPASDGLIKPEEIIAARPGFVCVTDHDTMRNVEEYEQTLARYGIRVVPGVEISTEHFGKEVHVLLYQPKSNGAFAKRLEIARQRRITRAKEITKRLRDIGFAAEDGFIELQNGAISKANVAYEVFRHDENKKALDEAGIDNIHAFIQTYLEVGCPANVPMQRIPLAEYIAGVDAVKVLAHPAKDLEKGVDDWIIEDMVKNHGFAGLECYTRDREGNLLTNYLDLAARLGIVPLRSNDCHFAKQLRYQGEKESTLDALLSYQKV